MRKKNVLLYKCWIAISWQRALVYQMVILEESNFGKLQIFQWLTNFNLANWWASVIEDVHSE